MKYVDVNQAYLKAGSKLQRQVFFKPSEIELGPNELLQIIRPLYGLSDSGDYWYETLTQCHISRLRMKQSTGDFALLFRRIADKLVGLSGSYVDDILQAGTTQEKKRIIMEMERKFDIKQPEQDNFEYTGIQCDTSNPRLRRLSQYHYISRLQALKKYDSFTTFRSMRARLAWVTHTRPDITCAVFKAAQITSGHHNSGCNLFLNRILRYLKRTPQISLQFHKLDLHSIQLRVYSDASFNDHDDNKSQIGYIILLSDDSGR